ncbi:MAG: YihY/virulence factor BrkB family protein [Corynebacteriales bacterium]|nr:YihY/virulence factor BrkB family protein [Mycobacteriales bacterium]
MDTARMDIAKKVFVAVRDGQMTMITAGVAFYATLAVFPALIAVVTVYALVADPAEIKRQLEPLTDALPTSAGNLLVEQLSAAANSSGGSLTIGLLVSTLLLIWSVSSGMNSLMEGLTTIFDVPETRSFVKRRAIALLFALGAIVGVACAMGLVAALGPILRAVGVSGIAAIVIGLVRWVGLLAAALVGLDVFYRFGPDRSRTPWQWVSWGSAIALGVWLIGTLGFSFYVGNFGSYNETYGTLAGFIVLMLWLYLSIFTALLGAQINTTLAKENSPA